MNEPMVKENKSRLPAVFRRLSCPLPWSGAGCFYAGNCISEPLNFKFFWNPQVERGRKAPLLSQPPDQPAVAACKKNFLKALINRNKIINREVISWKRNMIKYGLDWIGKTWTGLIELGLIQHGLIKHRLTLA